jgi:SAM-dependent methyltransferase
MAFLRRNTARALRRVRTGVDFLFGGKPIRTGCHRRALLQRLTSQKACGLARARDSLRTWIFNGRRTAARGTRTTAGSAAPTPATGNPSRASPRCCIVRSAKPTDRAVIPVEPSAAMRAQRPPTLATAIDATAERLPFPDKTFDAAMTTFSVHQWADLDAGLAEMRRVTRGPIVVLTGDPTTLRRFWLDEYAPEVLAPRPAAATHQLTGSPPRSAAPRPSTRCRFRSIVSTASTRPTTAAPKHCSTRTRGCRARRGASSARRSSIASPRPLRRDLDDGTWDARYGHLRAQPTFDGSLILLVNTP